MKVRRFRSHAFAAACVAAFGSCAASAAESDPRAVCEALAQSSTPAFRVDTAEWVDAAQMPLGPPGNTVEVPAHCLFRVTLDPRTSTIEDVSFGTGIELRLPLAWNGRLLVQGGGGLNGVLNAALGQVSGAPSALLRGFAVVSNDGGHRGRNNIDSRFAADQQAKLDFAYQAVATTTRTAKAVLGDYYGRAPDYSYFMGCSTGGREAMMAAERLPMEFDGIVAGNASWNLTRVALNQVWSLQTVNRIAPRDASGKPLLHEAFTDPQLQAVASAVTAECDALDGLADGMINDFQACRFDPASLQCGATGAPAAGQCLAAEQVTGLKDIVGGARDSQGNSLYGATPYDTGIALPSWRGMHLGSATGAPANASLGRDTLRLFAMTPQNPELDPLSFDFDTALEVTAETAAFSDPVATLHSSFVDHGGKLIVYHGLSDQAMWAGPLIAWYEALLPQTAAGPQDWARLFMVPGMTHCGGGQATDQFDMLTAIQQWVEEDKAPDLVVAKGNAFPDTTRPLCPFPQVARYDGGNVKDAASFSCR
jgi:feruloyl esterase